MKGFLAQTIKVNNQGQLYKMSVYNLCEDCITRTMASTKKDEMDVDHFLQKIGQLGPFQIRILAMFLLIFFPVTYQTLVMVFMAYEPPWMCATNSSACLLPNATGKEIFSTATKPVELYTRRCKLNRTDWKFADRELYEGPHKTIVTEVSQNKRSIFKAINDKPNRFSAKVGGVLFRSSPFHNITSKLMKKTPI